MVWQPLPNLEITVDYFHIDIEDRIVFSGNFTGARDPAADPPFGATAARFFTNAIDTETNGYDLVGNYQRPLLGGRIDLSAAYSNNETKVVGDGGDAVPSWPASARCSSIASSAAASNAASRRTTSA